MITGRIKGGIKELIQLLDDNRARSWKIVYDDERPANATVFISDDTQPREAEIERMKRVLANTSISRCFVIITSDSKNPKDNNNQIKYEFANAESAPAGVTGTYSPTGYTREDVERLVADGVERALMQQRKESLDEREKELKRQEAEYKDNQQKVGALVVNALAPYIGPLMEPLKNALTPPRRLAVAGLEGEDEPGLEECDSEEHTENATPGSGEAAETPDCASSADASRLAAALSKFSEWDDRYIDLIEKLVDLVTSGKPIAGMNYSTLRSLIMNL